MILRCRSKQPSCGYWYQLQLLLCTLLLFFLFILMTLIDSYTFWVRFVFVGWSAYFWSFHHSEKIYKRKTNFDLFNLSHQLSLNNTWCIAFCKFASCTFLDNTIEVVYSFVCVRFCLFQHRARNGSKYIASKMCSSNLQSSLGGQINKLKEPYCYIRCKQRLFLVGLLWSFFYTVCTSNLI